MMDIQRLIALAVFLLSAMMLWDAWQRHNAPPAPNEQPAARGTAPSAPQPAAPSKSAPPAPPASSAPAAAGNAPLMAAGGEPIQVHTDLFDAELSTQGGDIRRVTFRKVHAARDPNQPLTIMEPDPKHFFVTQSGLLGDGMPSHKQLYEAESRNYVLAPGQDSVEVRLHTREPNGIEVTKRLVFHRDRYEIDVAYDVANRGDKPVAPYAYFQFLRDGNPPSEQAAQTSSFGGVSTFTGPAIYTEQSKFAKINLKDIDKGKPIPVKDAKDGWIAIVQHYFVSAWLPRQGLEREYFVNKVGEDLYTSGVVVPVGTVAPGSTATLDVPVYIGPQEKERLDKVAPGLKLVVDYGWLYIIAAPIFTVLKWIHGTVGNWGWAIIILTILIKLIFYPLNAKAGRSMAQMKVLAPKMEKLKQTYGDDRQKLNQAMMELYRTEKINPLGGCLPIVVQIPVFIALYWVLLASIELRHAPWIGWIKDLSAPDPYFILPVIYAASMFLQTKLNPAPADPVQARVMLIMPIVFSIFFLFFPSGLVLYWVVQNMLSIVQQWHINRTIQREAKAKARH